MKTAVSAALVLLLAAALFAGAASAADIDSESTYRATFSEPTLSGGTYYIKNGVTPWDVPHLHDKSDTLTISGNVILDFSGFTGNFDQCSSTNGSLGCLFGNVSINDGVTLTIQNLVMTEVAVEAVWGSGYCGGILGYVDGPGSLKFVNCTVLNSMIAAQNNGAGGLVGRAPSVSFEDCRVSGCFLWARSSIGGLAGSAESAKIVNCEVSSCYVQFNSLGTGSVINIGGLVGNVTSAAGTPFMDGCTVTDCMVYSPLEGENIGGLIGLSGSATASGITGCHVNNFTISAVKSDSLGGLVGKSTSASVFNSGNEVNLLGICGNGEYIGNISGNPKVLANSNVLQTSVWINNMGGIGTPKIGPKNTEPTSPEITISRTVYHMKLYNSTTWKYDLVPQTVFGFVDETTTPRTITINTSIVHGSITVNPLTASGGTLITVTATPDVGYHVERVYFNMSGSAAEIPITMTGNVGTFLMPDVNATVSAEFAKTVYVPDADEYYLGGNIWCKYDDERKIYTLFSAETPVPAEGFPVGLLEPSAYNVTFLGWSNEDVKVVEILPGGVSLYNGTGVFSAFTNAVELRYFDTGVTVNQNVFGTSRPIYKVNATHSGEILPNGNYTGTAMTLETDWALAGQKVQIAVAPENGYAVYDWKLHKGDTKTGDLITPVENYIERINDPDYGSTTYVLTMPNSAVTVEPVLRDQGSTIVVYLFIDADSYVLEIPADFNIKKQDLPVTDKMVNLTACDMLPGHVLNVNMTSEGGYTNLGLPGFSGNTFVMSNIRSSADKAGYTIAKKQIYKGETGFKQITSNGNIVLSTQGFDAEALDDKITAGEMKTELEFTMKGVTNQNALGKYKDKLTFTVEIES